MEDEEVGYAPDDQKPNLRRTYAKPGKFKKKKRRKSAREADKEAAESSKSFFRKG